MRADWVILRATMETCAPLLIASGESDAMTDTDPVRDANDLPMLPATTLAGALRAAVGAKANDWFGFQNGDKGGRSAVTLTDGLFHWSDDKPRDGLITEPLILAKLAADAVCQHVLPGVRVLTRQHVRLNEHGVVDGDGKFTRDAVPTGARFTFEVRTHLEDAAKQIEAAIKAGLFLGGSTRAGYGEMACICFGRKELLLPRDMTLWSGIVGAKLNEDRGIPMAPNAASGTPAQPSWTLAGRIEGPLLIGMDGTGDEDREPWHEPQFVWTGAAPSPGSLKRDVVVIPGSAIKGPIRHRTLYHLRKAKVVDAEAVADALFGRAAEGTTGAAGLLRFHDVIIHDPKFITQTHVGLDRFTGGARRGVLFTDKVLWRPHLSIRITEVRPHKITSKQRAALQEALDDLCDGRLGIGAEWGEGAGIFAQDKPSPIITPPLSTSVPQASGADPDVQPVATEGADVTL